jgi:hypothetical protein
MDRPRTEWFLIITFASAVAVTTAIFQAWWYRVHWLLYSPMAHLLEAIVNPMWFAPTLAVAVFVVTSLGLLASRKELPRSNTVFALLLTILLPLKFVDQLLGAGKAGLVLWEATLLGTGYELCAIGLVWLAWFIARRSPSLLHRALFSSILSLYFVNMWGVSGVIFEGRW